ncbi:ion channel [Bacillus piscicola]|uniref:ion channel n=1 Tax=Bacillus piscicola TaxID=1632684 RepID=UPI001F09FBA0|nr:ion channel [Bacillus piscicola]
MRELTLYRKKIIYLSLLFLNIALSFAFVYLILETTGAGFIIDHYNQHEEISVLAVLWKLIYFSVITMAAVGYGDLTPIGYAQPVATVQAIFGYLFPIILVFVLTSKE